LKRNTKVIILIIFFCIVLVNPIGAEELKKDIVPYILLHYWDIRNEIHTELGVYAGSLFKELNIATTVENIQEVKQLFTSQETPMNFSEAFLKRFGNLNESIKESKE